MSDRLSGKRAAITAAGQGIGKATAIAFAREGARVFATDIDDGSLSRLNREDDRIEVARLDVTSPDEISRFVEKIGGVDVLFNCAGYVHHGTILDCEPGDWERSFAINVTSMYRIIRAFLPGMLEAGRGSIINMASVVSSVKGAPNRFAYGATKAGVIGLTKAVAADYVGKGIPQCDMPRNGSLAVT
jgi:2-dehydro-3-deoxy-L-fuconate 4-dehydrogenase